MPRILSAHVATVAVFLSGVLASVAAQVGGDPGPFPLKQLAARCGVRIGPALAYRPLVTEPIYADTVRREFDILTPENDMKWAPIHPQRFQYSFNRADEMVAFAASNGLVVHGHALVWHNSLPQWLTSGTFSRDEMIGILRDHIHTVAGRYSGRYLVAWDVVNEAVNDNGTLRRTLFLDRIGPDYVDLAFQFASEADPDAKLIYNDYNNAGIGAKSDAIFDLVSGMLVRGVPIHGVGFQMHQTAGVINRESLARNMQRFADLGLDIYITEMDVRIELPATEEKLATQARVYRDVLEVCLGQPACKAFQTWGFTDAHSWIPGFYPGFGAALIFDEHYRPKPAYDLLSQRLNECPVVAVPPTIP